jgi:hypothetical protein
MGGMRFGNGAATRPPAWRATFNTVLWVMRMIRFEHRVKMMSTIIFKGLGVQPRFS